jgi:hypothetical protein
LQHPDRALLATWSGSLSGSASECMGTSQRGACRGASFPSHTRGAANAKRTSQTTAPCEYCDLGEDASVEGKLAKSKDGHQLIACARWLAAATQSLQIRAEDWDSGRSGLRRQSSSRQSPFWDGGIKVWIGDIMNGHHSETTFSRENMGKAGQWLLEEAARIFPKAFQ